MQTNSLLVERTQICAAFGPVDLSAAANNGDWVSLKDFDSCAIISFKAAGTAGDDPTLTLRQATDVSGTNAKALDFNWINAHDPTRMAFNLLTSGGGSGAIRPPTHPSIAAALQSAATRNSIDPLLLARLQASEGQFDPSI